jgi:hypothetical protein
MESFNLGKNNIINAYGFIKLFYNSYPEEIYPFNTSNNNEIKINLNFNNTQTITHSIINNDNDNYIFVLTEHIYTNSSQLFIYLTIYFKNKFLSIPNFIFEKYKPKSITVSSKESISLNGIEKIEFDIINSGSNRYLYQSIFENSLIVNEIERKNWSLECLKKTNIETLHFLYLSYNNDYYNNSQYNYYNNSQYNYWQKQIEIIICNKIIQLDDENPFIKIYINNRKIEFSNIQPNFIDNNINGIDFKTYKINYLNYEWSVFIFPKNINYNCIKLSIKTAQSIPEIFIKEYENFEWELSEDLNKWKQILYNTNLKMLSILNKKTNIIINNKENLFHNLINTFYIDKVYNAFINSEIPVEIPEEITTEVPIKILDEILDILLILGPAETPTEAPAETPAEAPTEAPIEAQVEAPAETPTEAPVETPTEAPVETPTEAPAEAPAETPTEAPVEAPAEAPAETPAETPTEAPAETPTEAPAEAPAETPV